MDDAAEPDDTREVEGGGTGSMRGPAQDAGPRAPVPAGARGPGDQDGPDDVGGPHDVDGDEVANDPLRFSRWMKRSATGAVLSGIALGLQQALEQKREVPAFVIDAPGEPEDPDAQITLHFDPDDPAKTVAVLRKPKTEPPVV